MSSLKLGGGITLDQHKLKVPRSVQICIGGGERGRGVVFQTNSTQSVMICPIICIGGGWAGGGGVPDQLNPKCHNLSNICIWGVGVVQTNSTQSAKICPNLHWREGWCSRPTQPKVPRSVQICIFGGGGGGGGGVVVSRPTQPKVPRSVQICIWGGGGKGVVVQANIPEILEWGHSKNFEPKILEA